ncbi:MAG: 5'-nucleotidase C-terminal domain-containing protein, partial [Acidimicrobiia bacterium]|nr:5'-nucleotidase C-terminal domain-containing protein [Acidimicrobiia bacterium]
MLRGVDVMIAGGGDELLANPDDPLAPGDGPGDVFGPYPIIAGDADGNEVPVVTTSGQYRYLGKLVLDFNPAGELITVRDESGPRRVVGEAFPDGVPEDAGMVAAVTEPVSEFVAALGEIVIGTSEVALDGRRNSVRSMETNEGNLIGDALLWQADALAADFGLPAPDVALQNGGGIRNDSIIPAGDITLLDTFSMLPFGNFVSIVPDIPVSQFKEILENAYSRFVPGDTPGGSGRFAQIGGFTVAIDPTGVAQTLDGDGNVVTPGSRIMRVELDDGTVLIDHGVVVDGAATVNIATIDFLANGGDEYPYRGAPFMRVGVSYQQALANYIQGPLGGVISAADYPEDEKRRILVADTTLTLLHNNDAESDLLGSGDFGGAARFKTLTDQTRNAAAATDEVLLVTSGDNWLAGPEFAASTANDTFYDMVFISKMGYDALDLGNHDFDFGPNVLAEAIASLPDPAPPFLSANLDFSGEAALQALVDAGRIAASIIVEKNGEQYGIVGATTPNLPFISSPGGVVVDPDVAGAVQAEVDALTAAGVDKIVFISHLQDVEGDLELLSGLSGIDIAVAGGGDELLANPGDLLVPGDEGDVFGSYPLAATDADGKFVPVVTTSGQLFYLGKLRAGFDAAGNL